MKRIILKNWVKNVLLAIFIICVIIGVLDFESTKAFILIHVIDIIVLSLVTYILIKYTDLCEVL